MSDVEIVVSETGPYKVRGPIRLTTADGREIAVEAGKTVFLCRCGHSADKPFCDGTHKRVDFDGTLAHPKS